MENGVKVLYLQVLKSLYDCVESTLLWYDMYTKTLKSLGFIINPYDRCIKNSVIDSKHFTIAWYANVNKVSQVEEKVNTKIIGKIAEHFGEIIVSREKTSIVGDGYRVFRERKNIIS